MGDAGVVDETVHPAESLLRLGDEALDLVVAAHVAARRVDGDAQRLDGGLGEQRLGGDVAPGQVEVVEGDRGAALRELEAGRPAQPGGAAGHDDDAAGQALADALRIGPFLCHGRPCRRGGRRLPRGQ